MLKIYEMIKIQVLSLNSVGSTFFNGNMILPRSNTLRAEIGLAKCLTQLDPNSIWSQFWNSDEFDSSRRKAANVISSVPNPKILTSFIWNTKPC